MKKQITELEAILAEIKVKYDKAPDKRVGDVMTTLELTIRQLKTI